VDQDDYKNGLPLTSAARAVLPVPQAIATPSPPKNSDGGGVNSGLIIGLVTAAGVAVGLAFISVMFTRNSHWKEVDITTPDVSFWGLGLFVKSLHNLSLHPLSL